jgi:hypothetical protein
MRRLGGADQVHVLDDAPTPIADHALGTRLAGQPFVEGELQPFLAAVVDIGEAQHVCGNLADRIEATELALREHPGRAERDDGFGLVRIHVAAQVDEFLVGALREALGQRLERDRQGGGERRQAIRELQQFLRIGPDRFYRRRHRERLAIAVGDHAARSRDRNLAQETRIALLLVELVVEQLQIDRAHDQRARTEPEHAEHGIEPYPGVDLARARPHGLSTTISAPSGNFMPSWLRAIWSMRLVSAQVACSSCSRPNSMLSSSLVRSSALSAMKAWRWR